MDLSVRFDNMGSSNGISATVWISEIDVYEGTMKRAFINRRQKIIKIMRMNEAECKQTIDGTTLRQLSKTLMAKSHKPLWPARNQITQTKCKSRMITLWKVNQIQSQRERGLFQLLKKGQWSEGWQDCATSRMGGNSLLNCLKPAAS